MAQNKKKNSVHLTLYLRNCISYDFVYICKKMLSEAIFFIFFKILIFRVLTEVKRQKMTQNDQFQSVTLYISGTVDHIIKVFGTQV